MVDEPVRHITFAEAVLRRPAMYTMNGTFAEVVAFLDGYYGGASRGNLYAPPVVEWDDFELWLAARTNLDTRESFRHIWLSHSEDCDRISALVDLFAHFQAEQ